MLFCKSYYFICNNKLQIININLCSIGIYNSLIIILLYIPFFIKKNENLN